MCEMREGGDEREKCGSRAARASPDSTEKLLMRRNKLRAITVDGTVSRWAW